MTVKTLISESLLHQWADQGSSTVRSLLETALKTLGSAADASSINRQEQSTLYRLLYELLWIVLQAKVSRQDVLTLLNDVDLAKSPAACDVLIDLLWVVGNEVEAKEKGRERYSSPEWQALTRFVRDLANEEIVPALSLKAALEGDVLHHAGLLAEPALMNKKLVRVNTKTYYTQVKFNLLREESEGFAKVLSLLHTGVSKRQLQTTKTDLTALIGYFDLDANRVLDLALDAYEMQPLNDSFAELLDLFKRDNIPHVLGFKFQFYKRELHDGLVTPTSLYRLAATLIDKKVVDLDALMPHLSPSKEDTVQLALAKAKEMERAAKAFGKVNLGSKATSDEAPADGESAELDAAAVAKKKDDNQVLGLIMGLLDVGAHERAFEMIKWFKERNVDALTHEPLMTQMCVYLHSLLNDLYEPHSLKHMQLTTASVTAVTAVKTKAIAPSSPRRSASPVAALTPSSTDWLESLLSVLSVLGGNLHNDALLFTKVVRVITHRLNQASKEPETAQFVRNRVKDFMIQSLLPALSLQSCNPSTVFDMWELLKTYPFDERYRLYQQWASLYSSSPAMQLVEAQCVQNTRKIMRRLTADRAKPSARSLTHIAHSNPLVVFRTMLRQIQSYDNLIQPVVESLKFITPMGMDVLSFVLVSELSMSRKSMKADGTNISLWLVSLANFSGSFYRRYPNVELGGLLQYLIKRLENWESVDLVVLSELLSKMGSCITFEDISASQLEALAGGPHLWQEPSDPKLMNRRAIPRLREALIKRNLALPLCLLICQVRSKMENQEDSSLNHLKLLGRMSDTSQMTLSQLLQFLNGVVDPAVYTKMLPSVSELVQEYHILPELAMTICRPAIRFQDPILSKAPRGVNSTSSSVSSASDVNGSEAAAKSWSLQSLELLEDVGRAVTSVSASKDPFTGMTKDFFVSFWSMILYDIHVPFPQYEAEISRLRASLNASQNANATMTPTERKNLKSTTTQTIDKLITEQKDQVAHRKRVYERLETKKKSFFLKEDPQSQTAVSEVLQKCIIPRALLSPEDALFCAKFMERLHHINTPAFSTVQYYSKAVLQLPPIVLCVTEREAGNFGIFLKETLALLYRWNQSSVTYDEEAIHGKHGFSIDLANPSTMLNHRQYKSMYAKCHRSMVHLYSKTLASDEYMSIRNSLIVLTKLIDVFPSGKTAAECLLEVVEPLTQEPREDIKIMARRYSALLNKRKTTLVEDKMLAAGLTPPKKKASPVEPKTVENKPEDEESGQERIASDRESVSRESRGRERSSAGRDGGGRRGAGENGSSSREDRARGDRRGVSNSRDEAMETGGVKGDSSGAKDREGRSERGSGSKQRDSMRNDDRSAGNAADGRDARDGSKRDQRRGGASDRDRDRESGSQKSSRQQESNDRGRTTPTSETNDKREDSGSREPPPRRSRSRSAERRANKSRERERERERQKETKDSKISREAKDMKDANDVKETKDVKEVKEAKDSNDSKPGKEVTDGKDAKESKYANELKVGKTGKDTKDARVGKDAKSLKDTADTKDNKSIEGTKDTKGTKDVKDARDLKEPVKRAANQDDGANEDSHKRQRVDTAEALLRRQLTEKKIYQDQRKPATTSSDDKVSDTKAAGAKADDTLPTLARREAPDMPSERTRTPTHAESTNEPAPKKMISLVSSSRKREREREAAADKDKDDSAAAQPMGSRGGEDGAAGQDAKRRREGGSGGGNSRDEPGNRSGGRGGDQQPSRRNGDERRKPQHQQERGGSGASPSPSQNQNQSKHKSDGGQGQHRDQGRNNRPEGQRNGGGGGGGGNRDGNRGGGGRSSNNDRRRDAGGNNNGDRRGGGGGRR